MELDAQQPIPIYFQLKTLLLEEILQGRYGADGRLPTEHELCERFRISRCRVRLDDGVGLITEPLFGVGDETR